MGYRTDPAPHAFRELKLLSVTPRNPRTAAQGPNVRRFLEAFTNHFQDHLTSPPFFFILLYTIP